MGTPAEIRCAVVSKIQMAFRGITLGEGTSLRRAQLADHCRDAVTKPRLSRARKEIIDDWSKVPLDELEGDCIAHLDAAAFRYYIPALMLSVLNDYDSASMRVIGTLTGLYPKNDDGWEYHMHRYSLLNHAQKAAIANFLSALPRLVELDLTDQKIVSKALRNYWDEYLP